MTDTPKNSTAADKAEIDKSKHALEKLQRATIELRNAISDYVEHNAHQRPMTVISNIVIPGLLGTAPDWAKKQKPPSGWSIALGDVFNVATFCVYYHMDRDGKIWTLVQERKEKDPKTKEHKLGAIGGFADPKETLLESVTRETCEEVLDDEGRPIFDPKHQRFSLLFADTNPTRSPVALNYSAWAYELDAQEFAAIKKHVQKIESDPEYKRNMTSASGNEVFGLKLLPLQEIADRKHTKQFFSPRQHDAYQCVYAALTKHNKLDIITEKDPYYARTIGR